MKQLIKFVLFVCLFYNQLFASGIRGNTDVKLAEGYKEAGKLSVGDYVATTNSSGGIALAPNSLDTKFSIF